MEESREPEVDIEPLVTMTSSSNPAAQLLEVRLQGIYLYQVGLFVNKLWFNEL
jgi:hypothetical protein